MTDMERQQILDEEHLRLLRLGYLVVGANTATLVLIPLAIVAMGVFTLALPSDLAPDTALNPILSGWFLVVVGAAATVFMAVTGVMKLMTARALRLRRSRAFCLVTAALSCVAMPYGTVLGVFTFSVLARPGVAAQFAARAPAAAE